MSAVDPRDLRLVRQGHHWHDQFGNRHSEWIYQLQARGIGTSWLNVPVIEFDELPKQEQDELVRQNPDAGRDADELVARSRRR